MAETFDTIVVGGGPAGENVAARASEHGLSVALVESELLGGECSYWACMPSKALLRPTEALAAARAVPAARSAITGEVDVAAVLRSRDAFSSHLDDSGQAEWLASTATTLVRGHGRLVGERRVAVDTPDGHVRELTATRAVVLATGSSTAVPPIRGLAEAGAWGNREATQVNEVPRRLTVLGGGVVGSELAQAFARLGAERVVLLEADDRLLPREEPFVGEEVAAALSADGVDVRIKTLAQAVHREAPGRPVTVSTSAGDDVIADELLVAAGRRPNTDRLGLETAGLKPSRYIDVDDQLRATGVEGGWLYAVGDINGRNLLTHMGKYQARLAADAIAGREVAAWADHQADPRVVFTDPQVAAVGHTEASARAQGLSIRTVQVDTTANAGGALLGQGLGGTSQLVIDEARDVIVGATFTGPGVGELLHAATIAVAAEVPVSTLWHAVPSFPTVSELWLRLLEADSR